MDNPGWHAFRRADKEDTVYGAPKRGPDGQFQPVAQAMPMNDQPFVGGFKSYNGGIPPPKPAIPAEYLKQYMASQQTLQQPSTNSSHANLPQVVTKTQSNSTVTSMSAVERSQAYPRIARMDPHLQLMVGPLLRYDTVDEQGVWHGFALVVTSDAGSVYEPHPSLTYTWDPESPVHIRPSLNHNGTSFDLGGHPADPYSLPLPSPTNANGFPGPKVQHQRSPGQEIWVYNSSGGTYTFWRFPIHIPLQTDEMAVQYRVNQGQELQLCVPGRNQNMRWAAHSCNGFSAGINPDDFRGPGFKSGYDPLWTDLLAKHAEQPFHALVGGGDQLYCDSLMREPEMQEWVHTMKPERKKTWPLTDEMALCIDRFFFNHYCQHFRSGAFARANSSIPMINMCDDHDLIDGFGSYPDDLQLSPVFKAVGTRGYFFFLLFQCFINVDVDGLDDRPENHPNKSLIVGPNPGPYIPFPSHSFLARLGPQTCILLLDTRAERTKTQVCSPQQYEKVFQRLHQLPTNTEHVIVQLGVPIAYPRMVFLEKALDSKLNPLTMLGRQGSLGLSGFVNKFNSEAELLDDLNDHWTAKGHKEERNWFIEQLQHLAKTMSIRVSFVTGDVHCAAVGVLKTLVKGKNSQPLQPATDYRYMVNVTTSAIVNTPPPNGVITMVSTLATKTHKTMHHVDTDESMIPIFEKDTDGSARKHKYIMGRRNWCSVSWDQTTGDVVFDIRVEKAKGIGLTVGYAVRTPPPQWRT